MPFTAKPLSRQTIVITGASSGIGLATAEAAAVRGANLVLAARNGDKLREIKDELQRYGAKVEFIVADVGNRAEVDSIAAFAIAKFGRFDTWVNNAGVTIYGRIEEVADEDNERLFQTNFWGIVYGSKVAVKHLNRHGGTLINLGSMASDRSFPLQGMYCASKHAVKAFTDALRTELEKEGALVNVTLIKPASISTPLPQQAKNYLEKETTLPSPLYAPEEVAHAILYAAEHRIRDVYVGSAAKILGFLGQAFPRLTDRISAATLFSAQKRWVAAISRVDNLHQAGPKGGLVRENPDHRLIRPSLYTRSVLHPLQAAAAVGVAIFAGRMLLARPRRNVVQTLLPRQLPRARRWL